MALGGALQIVAGVGRRTALGQDLVGPGERALLAVADLDQRLVGRSRRLLAPPFGEARPCRLHGQTTPDRGIAVGGQLDGPVDVTGRRVQPTDGPARRRPPQQQQRLTIGGRSESPEEAEQGLWLHRVGDGLAELHHELRRSAVVAGVEQEVRRLDDPAPLEQLARQPLGDGRVDGSGAERGRHRQLEAARQGAT